MKLRHFFLNFFSYFFFLISIVLFTYLIYKIQSNFSDISFAYKVYLFLSIVIFFFSFIFYFAKDKFKIILLICIFSAITAGYCFEIFINIDTSNKYKIYEAKTGKKYDRRTKYEIYKDLKENEDIRPGTYPYQFLKEHLTLLPLSTFSKKKIIYCNENGYYSIYKSDRFGFNNLDNIWNEDTINYLLIGDSFTNGACVNSEDNIAGNLKKLSQKNNVLNLGVGGGGPLTEYAIFKEYVPNIKKINRILWIYYEGNDLSNINEERGNNILKNYLKENYSQNLIIRNTEINNFLEDKLNHEEEKANKELKDKKIKYLTDILKLSKTRGLLIGSISQIFNTKNSINNSSELNYENVKNIFYKIINNVKKFADKEDTKLYFIYLPDSSRYVNNNNTNTFKHYDKVLNLIKSLNIPIIDVNENLGKVSDNPLEFYSFGTTGNHFNENGYKKVSEIIYKVIKKYEEK